MNKKEQIFLLLNKLKQYISIWFHRKNWWVSLIPGVVLILFFWVFLAPPPARPKDVAIVHFLLIPVIGLIVQAGIRKGYRRLFFYPLLLVLIVAAEMLNFDLFTQYYVESPLRYGCTLVFLMILADIGLTLAGKCLKLSVVSVIAVIVMQLSALILFVGIIVRNVFGGKPLEIDSVRAVFQTDIMEALLFVAENPSLGVAGGILLILGIAGGIWYSRNNWFQVPSKWKIRVLLAAVGIGLCLISCKSINSMVRRGKLSTFALLVSGNHFRAELYRFSLESEKRKMQPLQESEKKLVRSRGENGRFILVIGESNNRDYMSCYGYKKPTTPFLDKMTKDPRFLFFTNAYSNHVHTNEVLKYFLSEQNQYNPDSKFKVTLFDVLRHCGYFSTFISNQYLYDSLRSPVSAIAKVADHQIYLNTEMDFVMKKNRLDMETVTALQKQPVRSRELIVLHLMSCHAPYQIRYPVGFRSDLDGDYERAIAYLDQVLKGVFEYAMQDQTVNGVIFIPDHGEDVVLGDHDSAGFTVNMIRIPMICYFNPEYLARNPELQNGLKKSVDKVFTNDLVFDFLLDVMGIKTDFNDQGLHLLSDRYRIDMENGRTLHGRSKLDGTFLKKQ